MSRDAVRNIGDARSRRHGSNAEMNGLINRPSCFLGAVEELIFASSFSDFLSRVCMIHEVFIFTTDYGVWKKGWRGQTACCHAPYLVSRLVHSK